MPVSLAVGDLNSDTHLDLVAVLGANNSIVVFIGTGFASFAISSTLSLDLDGHIGTPVLADFNNDHHLDIALVNTWNHKVIIAIGLGDGSFGEVKQFYTGFTSFPVSISVSDLNKDGNLDFVILNRGSASIDIFLGIGNASFDRLNLLSEYMVDTGLIAVADFNGDYNQDILVINKVGDKMVVFLGDGDNGFEFKLICLQLPFVSAKILAVRYTNANEVPDIVIGTSQELFLIRNQARYWEI